jgi:radical SAM superfamily enzyme YgiQ (UPF0313 family)
MVEVLHTMTQFQREHDYPFIPFSQVSTNIGWPQYNHLIPLMKHAGFGSNFLGFENPNPEALKQMNKHQNVKGDLQETIQLLQQNGMQVYGGFIFGADPDTPETATHIIEFVEQANMLTAMTGILSPLPHTPLYAELIEQGRLDPDIPILANNSDDSAVFDHPAMSHDEIRTSMQYILRTLYNRKAAYARAGRELAAVKPHIFSSRNSHDMRPAIQSMLRQGVARMDPNYFRLLWQGHRMDRKAIADAKKEARGHMPDATMRQYATEFRIRMKPEMPLDDVYAEPEQGMERDAMRYLDLVQKRHAFPGPYLVEAVTKALKAEHYVRVAENITRK